MSYWSTVRFGKMRLLARFKTEQTDFKTRTICVVKTDRGSELGTILSAPEEIPREMSTEGVGNILRKATREDLWKSERIAKEDCAREKKYCRETIQKLQLPMKLVDVDHLFGGERIIFYFVSETRVDFRELVKQLAQEFKTRIELKQIGARDEAKLVGDIGHCGLTLCCASFLQELGGITMDMAKIQKHTSDPNKITGRCGKLLCCLRYEYTLYTEARDAMPAKGAKVQTQKFGDVLVLDHNLILREMFVERGDGEKMTIKLSDIVGGFETRVPGCDGCAVGRGPAPDGAGQGGSQADEEPPPENGNGDGENPGESKVYRI